MADDVYKLVQQALAQKQGGGRNQFYNPTADIAMQIPSMIRNMQDVELAEDTAQIGSMEKVIQSSNNFQSLNNAQKMINEFEPNASLEPEHQFLQNTITTKMNNYKQGKMALNEVSSDLEKYEDYTEKEIRAFNIEDLKNEMLKVADLNDKLQSAQGMKFQDSNISLQRGGRAVADYYKKLTDTWSALATEDIVTEEEAQAIFMGNFEKVKKETVEDVDQRLTQSNKTLETYRKLYFKAADGDVEATNALKNAMQLDESATLTDITEQYADMVEKEEFKSSLLRKKKRAWTTIASDDYDEMSKTELEQLSFLQMDPEWNNLTKEEQNQKLSEAVNAQMGLKPRKGDGKKKKDKYKMSFTGKDEDFNYSGDSVYEGILSMEQGERALRNNNPGAINFPSNPDSVFIKQFGVTKKAEETYYEYTDEDGNRVQVFDINKVPEDKRGDVKEYTTATFPSKEMGEKALQHIIREKLKSADGDIDKFVQSYTGLEPGSSEFNAYKQKLASGEVGPSFVEEYNLDDAAKIAAALGTVYVATDPSQVTKAVNLVKDSTIKATNYLRGSLDISANNITEFFDSKQVKGTVNKIEKLEKQIENATGTNKKTLTKRLNNIKKSRSTYWAKKWFGDNWKSRLKDVDNLWDVKNRSKWNIFNVKRNVSNAFKNPGWQSKFAGAASRGLIVGDLVNEAFGTDLGTAGKIVTGVGTEQVAKRAYGKIKTIVNSPKGRKWLLKRVGKSAAKRIIGGTLAGGGIASLITGIAGTGLAAYEIYDLLKGDEVDEIIKEIEEGK